MSNGQSCGDDDDVDDDDSDTWWLDVCDFCEVSLTKTTVKMDKIVGFDGGVVRKFDTFIMQFPSLSCWLP